MRILADSVAPGSAPRLERVGAGLGRASVTLLAVE